LFLKTIFNQPPEPLIVPANAKKAAPEKQVLSKFNRSLPILLERDLFKRTTRATIKEELRKLPVLKNMKMADTTMPPPTKKVKNTKKVAAKPR
jgi:hypothetical protein